MIIWCCYCEKYVDARLTDGREIYPHRSDLKELPFWIDDNCGNYVGCHHKTKEKIKPLGNIPTKEIRDARKHIHALLDPLWKSGKIQRKQVYRKISDMIGYEYHTSHLKTIDECRNVYRVIQNISKSLTYRNSEV